MVVGDDVVVMMAGDDDVVSFSSSTEGFPVPFCEKLDGHAKTDIVS